MKKLLNGIGTLCVTMVVVLAVLLVGVRVVGLQPYVILSGSMEPTYHVGALIYVKEIEPEKIKAGDTITFMANETTIVTHRVEEVVPDEQEADTLWFVTKGDANETVDAGMVHYRNVIGKALFSIPYLGYISNYIQTPPGMYVALAGGAILLILTFLPQKKKEQKEN